MTQNEFEAKQQKLLEKVPQAFRSWLAGYAWEEGHAFGYDEVLIHLDELVSGFLRALNQYRCPTCDTLISENWPHPS